MIAATLQQIRAAETKADNILAQANQKVQAIKQQTYQTIEQINQAADTAIATAVAALPQPTVAPLSEVTLNVPQNKIDEAVAFVMQAFPGV